MRENILVFKCLKRIGIRTYIWGLGYPPISQFQRYVHCTYYIIWRIELRVNEMYLS